MLTIKIWQPQQDKILNIEGNFNFISGENLAVCVIIYGVAIHNVASNTTVK